MAKYETPPPIRPLEKLITDFSYTNGLDPVNVFNDFLTYIIHGFSPGAPPLQNWKYKQLQNMKFMEILTGWVRLMASRIKDDTSWYDPFGDLYMALVSKNAQQSQGQFFTPVYICDLKGQHSGNWHKASPPLHGNRSRNAAGSCMRYPGN